MLKQETTSAVDHWQEMELLVQKWLGERQRLLYLLCSIQGIAGLTSQKVPVHHRIREFCQALMDYISTGYFEMYQGLAREARLLHEGNTDKITRILAQITDSTDEALAFNEDFDNPESLFILLDQLPARLSILLEKLEERFALEDELVVSIHRNNMPGRRH